MCFPLMFIKNRVYEGLNKEDQHILNQFEMFKSFIENLKWCFRVQMNKVDKKNSKLEETLKSLGPAPSIEIVNIYN